MKVFLKPKLSVETVIQFTCYTLMQRILTIEGDERGALPAALFIDQTGESFDPCTGQNKSSGKLVKITGTVRERASVYYYITFSSLPMISVTSASLCRRESPMTVQYTQLHSKEFHGGEIITKNSKQAASLVPSPFWKGLDKNTMHQGKV